MKGDLEMRQSGRQTGAASTAAEPQAWEKAARTARWATTMTKVRIRRISARTRWQLVEFRGDTGGESVGIVDLLAVRKDHRGPQGAMRRGDALELIFIQVKGGTAAMPTADDWKPLRAVARRHRAKRLLLAIWQKGKAVQFFTPKTKPANGRLLWTEVDDLNPIFQ
jgi:hypothetical protein